MTDQILEERPVQMLAVDLQVTPLKKNKKKELACAVDGAVVNGGVVQLSSANAHTLTFQLAAGTDYSFVAEADDPFCSKTDDCPRKGDQTGQFHDAHVSPDGQSLTVIADPSTDP